MLKKKKADNVNTVHLGGKIMQHVLTLRKISLILCFVLSAFGCATGKNRVSNIDIGLRAETVPEGISLSFDYIPPETTRIFVGFTKGLVYSPPANPHDEIFSYSSIMGDSLEQVKKTGRMEIWFSRWFDIKVNSSEYKQKLNQLTRRVNGE
jgi:hypothetical protein